MGFGRNFTMRFSAFISFFFFTFAKCDIPRIRGVSISKASLYPAGEHFTCFDGKQIKFIQVEYRDSHIIHIYLSICQQLNDEFCDCPDSSDEPGTSACPGGSFYCTNLHHRPKTIVSSRVNDGICDCCDGSDEYNNTNFNIKCENTCLEMGREEREKTKARQELLKKGSLIKNEMIVRGKALKVERGSKLLELDKRKSEAEAIKAEKDKIKNEVEALENDALSVYREIEEQEKIRQEELNNQEAENTFKSYDTNGDGIVDIPEIQSLLAFDKDNDGVVSEDEAMYFLNEKDKVDLENFKSDSWHKIKSQIMVKDGVFSTSDNQNDDDIESVVENREDDEEEEETGEGDVEEQHEEEPRPNEVQYDSQTQQLIDQANQARNELSEAERVIRELENEIKDLSDVDNREYGLSEEFASLIGECFDFEDREYIYKLCPFERASQQPKDGGSETR